LKWGNRRAAEPEEEIEERRLMQRWQQIIK